ncbi:MAG: DNA polymerase III, subunit gamma and tau, partial [Desulfovibrio piger]|nr:DNA polymerase III, subunit gamma and tau [Desulfovibrio piger]
AALELLLLNLALLPQLLPLVRMDSVPAPSAPVQGHPAHDRQEGSPLPPRDMGHAAPVQAPATRSREHGTPAEKSAAAGSNEPAPEPAPSRRPGSCARPQREMPARQTTARPARVTETSAPKAAQPRPEAPEHLEHVGPSEAGMIEADDIPAAAPVEPARPAAPTAPVVPAAPAVETRPAAPAVAEGFRPDWQAFCDFCAQRLEKGEAAPQLHLLRQLRASWEPDCLRLTPKAETLLHQTEKQRPQLEQALAAWGAGHLRLEFVAPRQARTEAELIEEFRNRPEMQACLRLLNANIEHCTESNQGDTHA